jgi:DDE family transposase
MRSFHHSTVTPGQLHQWALQWLLHAEVLKPKLASRRLCTPTVLWNVLLRAAARLLSIAAVCRDLADGPSDQAIFDALEAGLPKTWSVLDRRLNHALSGPLNRRALRRRAWRVAIDWHLVPYYGEPHRKRNELYYGKPRQGTKKFHAYATACIVQHGHRYTLAQTWVRRHESTVTVLKRLLARLRELRIRVRCALLDRAFFNVPVTEWLQQERLPFLMPVMFRGRPVKNRRAPARGLHWIRRQRVGRYAHTLRNRRRTVQVTVVVAYRTYWRHGKRHQKKLLFAAWRVGGTPQEIRHAYRKRFGIETSYRQMRQARIFTSTRQPQLRWVFVVVALLLRNLWVWVHEEHLRTGEEYHFEALRFRQLLSWIARVADAQDGEGQSLGSHDNKAPTGNY